MSLVDKYGNVLDDKKEAVVMMPLPEKKSLTTEKVATSDDEKLEDMKEGVVTIRRKGSYNFEGQSKGYTGWFSLDSDFLKIKLSTIEPDFYKNLCEKDI